MLMPALAMSEADLHRLVAVTAAAISEVVSNRLADRVIQVAAN